MNAVSFENVRKSFGRVEALAGVTLGVPEGSVFGLVGRNGAGKSTLLRMIPPLLHPTSGEVRVLGLDPWADGEAVRKDLGYVSENDSQPPLLRVQDLLELYQGLYAKWDETFASRLLEQFKIERRTTFGTLSKGQKRQVSLICAVSHRPRLLVLDEPGGGLDVVARRRLLETVLEFLAGEGSTVLFSSHHLGDVERIATRVGILHRGRLLADRPADELKEGACRAAIHAAGIERAALIERLPALRVVSDDGRHVVTLLCRPEEAEHVLEERLGSMGRFEMEDVHAVNLEELLLDWTGDEP